MKKYRFKISLRIIAFILVLVCGVLALTGALTACYTYEMGLYTKPLDKVIQNKQKIAQEIAVMRVFEHRKQIENKNWVLKDTNIEYGIIQAKNISDDKDLSDKNLYWDYHFNDTAPDSHSYISGPFYENDGIQYSNRLFPSLSGNAISHYKNDIEDYTSGLMPVTQICYNADNGVFYFSSAQNSYPVTIVGIDREEAVLKPNVTESNTMKEYYPEEHHSDLGNEKNLTYFRLTPDEKEYVSISGNYKNLDTTEYRLWDTVSLYTYTVDTISIPKIKSSDLLPRNKNIQDISLIASEEIDYYGELWGYEGYDGAAGSHKQGTAQYTMKNSNKNNTAYWIVSNVKPRNQWNTKSDLIAKQYLVLTNLYNYRYMIILFTIATAIIALLAAAFCIWSAGFRLAKEQDEREFCGKQHDVILTWWQKIPLEIFLIAGTLLLFIIAAGMRTQFEYLLFGDMPSWLALALIESSFLFTIGCLLIMAMNVSHRVHGKILGKYMVSGYIWGKIKGLLNLIKKETSLLIKAAIIFAAICFVEFLIIIYSWGIGNGFIFLFFWGWFKIVEFALIILAALQLKALQKGSQEMAEGNLSHTLDTKKMLWEFKKHGDNLNKIHEGFSIALNERMKSEHFKTELITNVSHDIKTPLTSIINYVDLLQKEGVTEEAQKEYLEVLDRQSKRLKKLIEDLIEASKASTGNLSVNLEPCDLDILITQAVGEFEEKLMQADLKLIISGSGKGLTVQADSRHLWRIFDNLMNNICKYAQPGTRVYINQVSLENQVSIIFRNTSREELNISEEELMERFVRGDSSRNTEGNGLGLSIARNLTELMGGVFQIHVDGDLFKVVVKFSL